MTDPDELPDDPDYDGARMPDGERIPYAPQRSVNGDYPSPFDCSYCGLVSRHRPTCPNNEGENSTWQPGFW